MLGVLDGQVNGAGVPVLPRVVAVEAVMVVFVVVTVDTAVVVV